jgi:amidase
LTDITRRAALFAPALAAAACASVPEPVRTTTDLAWMDATETAARVRRREVSAAETVDAAIGRAEALNPQLGFLVTPDFDRARARAATDPAGLFGGVPFLVKDLDDYVGLPTRHGSRVFRNAAPSTEQPALIDAYDLAGLVTLGKSATPEHGYLPTTEPIGASPTRNPWDTSRSSGGSSGGAAAAVAAGVVPVAHASDGGGSIRIPASCCGLFGLKPSTYRLRPWFRGARDAAPVPLSVQHAVTRTVRDSAGLFAATEDTSPGARHKPVGLVTGPARRRLRVGLMVKTGTGLEPDPEVKAALDSTVVLLDDLGHRVTPTLLPVDGEQFSRDFLLYWATGADLDVKAARRLLGREPTEADMEPFSLGMARLVQTVPDAEIGAAVRRLAGVAARYEAWFADYDVILSPVLRSPPVPLGHVRGDVAFQELSDRLTAYVGYTPLHNVAGAPAMSVPLHWTADGLPVGSHFAAKAGDERTLFELAYELEAARPWAGRKPPVSA